MKIKIFFITLFLLHNSILAQFETQPFDNFRYNSLKSNSFNLKIDTIYINAEIISVDNKKILSPNSQGFGRINDIIINPRNNNEIYAAAASGGLWKSINYGDTWDWVNIQNKNFGINKILIDSNEKIYVLTGDQKIPIIGRSPFYGLYEKEQNGNWLEIEIADSIKSIKDIALLDNILLILSDSGIYSKINSEFKKILNLENFDKIFQFENQLIAIKFGKNNNHKSIIQSYYSDSFQIMFEQVIDNSDLLTFRKLDTSVIYLNIFEELFDGIFYQINEAKNPISEMVKNTKITDGQAAYNHSIHKLESENLILTGGINLYYSKDEALTWVDSTKNIHKDVHDIELDTTKKMIYIATDGGVYRKSYTDENWKFLTIDFSITQFFSLDINTINKNIIAGGTMDNGSILFYDSKTKWIGGGDGFRCNFLKDGKNIVLSQANGRIIQKNIFSDEEINLSLNLPNDIRKNFFTNFDIDEREDLEIYYYSDDIWKISEKGKKIEKITNENNVLFAKKIDNSIYYSDSTNLKILNLDDLTIDTLMTYKNQNRFDIVDIEKNNNSHLVIQNSSTKYFEIDENREMIYDSLATFLENRNVFDIELAENGIYLATEDGMYFYNKSNYRLKLFMDTTLPIFNVRKIKYNAKNGEIIIATFANNIRKIKINDCSSKKIELNLLDTIYKCAEEIITLESMNYQSVNWSNGDVYKLIKIQNEGNYWAFFTDTCNVFSEIVTVLNKEKSPIILNSFNQNPCESDKVLIKINSPNNININNITWNNGKRGESILIEENGKYWATYQNENGCVSFSDTIAIKYQIIEKTELNYTNGILYAIGDTGNWYLDELLIKENSDFIQISKFGSYKFESNTKNCNKINKFEFNENDDFIIYPNPTENSINLEIYKLFEETISIQILDLKGKLIKKLDLDYSEFKPIKIDLRNFASGEYILTIQGKNYKKNKKLIIN